MNLYVFEDVLVDYTPGMAMVAGENYEDAVELARDQFGDLIEEEEGWKRPVAVYPVTGVKAGVKHYMHGGG
jgi:hypothetical protein